MTVAMSSINLTIKGVFS